MKTPALILSTLCLGVNLTSGWLLTQMPGAVAQPPRRLTPTEVKTRIQRLPTWTLKGQELQCTYKFENFVQAVAFVNQLVKPAEAAQHHPDLEVGYGRVGIRLSTHDAGGLTDLDFKLAEQISQLPGRGAGCVN
jgi:4a-hydroxytetrahydrobiopterin dehydratase